MAISRGCSRRRASSEGEGSGSVAAGGAPSAAKTGSAVLTSRNFGRENVRAATSSRGPGSSILVGLTSALGL